MADDEEERTEEATGRRLADAHGQGDVALSREVVTIVGLLAAFATLDSVGSAFERNMVLVFKEGFLKMGEGRVPDLLITAGPLVGYLIVLLAAAGGASAAAVLAQTGGGLWLDKAIPDFSRISGGNPFAGMMRVFTREYAIDLALTLIKVAAIAWVAWGSLRREFVSIERFFDEPPAELLNSFMQPLRRTGIRITTLWAVFAAGDWYLTRYRYRKKMRMTKEEVKREHKNTEGDPAMKGRRKRKGRELVRQMARQEVPRADVLVTNPTHLAVAIRYRKSEGNAPRVTAKGAGAVADLMRDLARTNAVPIVEDVALARLLYRRVRIGSQVPEQTFKAVAAILAFVYRITRRRPG